MSEPLKMERVSVSTAQWMTGMCTMLRAKHRVKAGHSVKKLAQENSQAHNLGVNLSANCPCRHTSWGSH